MPENEDKPVEIEVCERMYDFALKNGVRLPVYHARPRDEKTRAWGYGQSVEDAIQSLLRTAPADFPGGRKNLVVYWTGVLPR